MVTQTAPQSNPSLLSPLSVIYNSQSGLVIVHIVSFFKKKMSFLRGRDSADELHRRQIRKMFDKADKENIVKVCMVACLYLIFIRIKVES